MSKELISGISELQSAITSTTQQSNLSPHNKQIALERELAQLTKINATMTNALNSIGASKGNLEVLLKSTGSTNSLLDLYIKILSQNNFTQYLLNNPNWNGGSKDEMKWLDKVSQLELLMKETKEEQAKRERELETQQKTKEMKVAKLKQRQEILSKRVYGNTRRTGNARVDR